MDEATVLTLFDTCSNIGRWGEDDELGTLNFITQEKTLAALALPRAGRVVSLGHDLVLSDHSSQEPHSASIAPRYRPVAAPMDAHDTLTLNVHGFEATHIDAPGHCFFDGRAWGGRNVADIARPEGLAFGSILPLARRGIAAIRDVAYLSAGDGISAADLDAAAGLSGVSIESGDAIFVRTGHAIRRAREGGRHDEDAPHEGVLADVMPWLHESEIAVFAADCIEQRPSGYARVPMPLHQIGLARMGLCILDVPDVEALAAACAEEGRHEFLLMASPLRIPGGTGSAVNPLAIF